MGMETLSESRVLPLQEHGRSASARPSSTPRVLLSAISLHVHFHVHPWMDAALEEMLALRKARDVEAASLKDARPGHRDVLEAADALRNAGLAMECELRSRPFTYASGPLEVAPSVTGYSP
jgi:hypothetical protein